MDRKLENIIDDLDCMTDGAIVNKGVCVQTKDYLYKLAPKVPQFIADWYEDVIDDGVYYAICLAVEPDTSELKRIHDWFELLTLHDDVKTDDVIAATFVRMSIFGYEVQEWN